ncbi:MAG: hypothetical protein ACPG7F_04325 [Aggregatilineales bacterium]
MSQKFLDTVMQFASTITDAERSLAVDLDLNIQGMINLDKETVREESFIDLASATLHQAISKNEAIITNNVVTDPTKAPTTNTNFSNLRVIVAIPVREIGAVYVDQHIREGIIARETTDKIQSIIENALDAGKLDITSDELIAQYETSSV